MNMDNDILKRMRLELFKVLWEHIEPKVTNIDQVDIYLLVDEIERLFVKYLEKINSE